MLPYLLDMLAEHLVSHRQEVIRRVNSCAGTSEEPGLARGRKGRIGALLDELIEVAKQRQGHRHLPRPRREASVPDEIYCHERELIRQAVIDDVTAQALALPPTELVILCDWAYASDCSRLRERCRRLSELLDDIGDTVVLLETNGRIEYLNRQAASHLHDATGIPLDRLVGSMAAEMGLGLRPEKLVALARGTTSAEEFLFGKWNETTYKAHLLAHRRRGVRGVRRPRHSRA